MRFSLLCREENAWTRECKALAANIVIADIPHYSLQEQTRLPRLLRVLSADLLLAPHFNVPYFCPVKTVLTVHDLILHRFPNGAPLFKRLAYRLLLRRAVTAAAGICAVSRATADDVCTVYGESLREKITVTGEGVEPHFVAPSVEAVADVRSRYALPARFLLYVGNAKSHKNLPLLLSAFETLADPGLSLVLVTGGPEAEKLMLPNGVSRLPNFPDADLPALYGAAAACVTPSLYEGYCLPVAEALACGCPVLAVNASCLPEVTAGFEGVILCEPTLSAWLEGLRRILLLPRPPAQPRPWASAAKETAEALRRALGCA